MSVHFNISPSDVITALFFFVFLGIPLIILGAAYFIDAVQKRWRQWRD